MAMLHGGLTLPPPVPGTRFGSTVTSRRKGRKVVLERSAEELRIRCRGGHVEMHGAEWSRCRTRRRPRARRATASMYVWTALRCPRVPTSERHLEAGRRKQIGSEAVVGQRKDNARERRRPRNGDLDAHGEIEHIASRQCDRYGAGASGTNRLARTTRAYPRVSTEAKRDAARQVEPVRRDARAAQHI